MNGLTHITPHFLPQVDGLGDYSRLLAIELKQLLGAESKFIVGDPTWSDQGKALPFAVEAVRTRSAEALSEKLASAETLIVHFVVYGYHPRGIPFWFNRAVRRWKRENPKRRLVVVFHELWAVGPPWKSEFYLGFLQKRLVTQLHHLCDAAMTSTPVMYRRLEAILPGKTVFQPIPSNLPALSLDARKLHRGGPVRVVAFGLGASRLQSIQKHENLLRALHRENLLAGVHVVGQGAAGGESASADVRLLRQIVPEEMITVSSNVTPDEGARLLGQADLYLSYYPSFVLHKSGALMAAMACGCVPLLAETRDAEPLAGGRELLACDGSDSEIASIVELVRTQGLAPLAEAGRAWYEDNASWKVVARKMSGLLGGLPAAPTAAFA